MFNSFQPTNSFYLLYDLRRAALLTPFLFTILNPSRTHHVSFTGNFEIFMKIVFLRQMENIFSHAWRGRHGLENRTDLDNLSNSKRPQDNSSENFDDDQVSAEFYGRINSNNGLVHCKKHCMKFNVPVLELFVHKVLL